MPCLDFLHSFLDLDLQQFLAWLRQAGVTWLFILMRQPMFEWCLVGCKNIHQKDVFKGDWTTCLQFVNYVRFNTQHNSGMYMIMQEEADFSL